MIANRDDRFDRRVACVIVWIAIGAVLFAGIRPLWEPDEGRYAEVAREMIRTGEYLVPHLGPVVHLTKPPVAYWFTALGLELFGVNSWGARIPLVLAFLVTVWCVLDVTRSMRLGERTARLATLVYLTSFLPFVAGHVLTCDTYVVAFEAVSIAAAWRVWTRRPGARWVWVHWLALAAAFMTKGPPGLLPIVVIAAHALVQRDARLVRALWKPLPCSVCAVSASSWFVAVGASDPAILRYFVRGELVDHLMTSSGKTPESAWIYVPILLAGALPWSLTWWGIVRSSIRAVRDRLRPRSTPMEFVTIWFALPLVVFMLARSRSALYVLPLFAPLSIACAHYLCGLNVERWFETRARRALVGIGAVLWVAVLVTSMVLPDAAPGSRSYVGFCDRLRELDPSASAEYWSVRRFSVHSVEFELDRVVERRTGNTRAVARELLRTGEHDGVRRVLLLTTKQARSLLDRPDADPPASAFEVMATRRGMIAVRASAPP